MKDTKQCPFCGKTIKSVAIRCRYCKEWLMNKELANPLILFGVTYLILILGVTIYLFLSHTDFSKPFIELDKIPKTITNTK